MEEIKINPFGNIAEQVEELCPKSQNDYDKITAEIRDNLTSVLFMDECGQVWTSRTQGLQYLAKCKL